MEWITKQWQRLVESLVQFSGDQTQNPTAKPSEPSVREWTAADARIEAERAKNQQQDTSVRTEEEDRDRGFDANDIKAPSTPHSVTPVNPISRGTPR